ncbi:MAG: hypothetical protein OQL09_06465 [Gammaproteobacteria bacterium]|nr:hypothetical protein [Gammaproteobacteria bacterium]
MLVSLGLTLAITAPLRAETGADDHQHGHDEHGASGLSLNQGKKWQTDAPLRQGMNSINEAVKKAVPAFHHDELNKADAKQLAKHINDQVNYLVANCKLEPQADATLHVLIGELLTSADKLSRDPLSNQGMPGLVKALMQYPNYFEHQGWKSVIHE